VNDHEPPSMWAAKTGRPNLADLLTKAKQGEGALNTAILVCGPTGLVDTCRNVAIGLKCDFHAETFFM